MKRIYLCIQQMYLEDDISKYQELYLGFVKDCSKPYLVFARK